MVMQFLKRYMLAPACYDLETEVSRFREEMQRGLEGEKSSLLMIPTFVSPEAGEIAPQTVIVLDAGGTNLRVGAVTFSGGVVTDVDFQKYPLPGTAEPLTKTAFFDAIAEKLAPYLDRGSRIGFCFSYAADCMENHDAKIVAFCKEVTVTGAEGAEICKELSEAIRRRGIQKTYSFVQLNDTVATQLGGMAASDRGSYGGYIGFILGTGMNGCYTERTERIEKYTGGIYRAENMIVNMEAGCYSGFEKGALDRAVDAQSAIPGDHQAEKMMSGAYLGKILCHALKAANAEGITQSAIPQELSEIPMPDVNAFLANQPGMLDALIAPQDRETVRAIIEGLYSRTARLMAIIFASVALHTGQGAKKPMCIVLEGSTYQKSPRLQAHLAEELETVRQKFGCRFEIIQAENPTLTGSAYAAVSN